MGRWLETKDIKSPECCRHYIKALNTLARMGYSVQVHGDGSVGVYNRSDTPGDPVIRASKPKRLPAALEHLKAQLRKEAVHA